MSNKENPAEEDTPATIAKSDLNPSGGPPPSTSSGLEQTPERPALRFDIEDDEPLVESEPYLGPAWAVVMLILYFLKEAFPAETYSLLWWFQIYIIGLVMAITIFTLIKRRQFYSAEKRRRATTDGT